MRLLFLSSRLPYPPDRGDRLRTYWFLQQFCREHSVTLVSFVTDDRERRLAAELTPLCEEMYLVRRSSLSSFAGAASNVWRNLPLQALYYRSRQMSRLVDDLVTKRAFDVAYVHLFRMWPYMSHHASLYRITDLTDQISLELQASLPYRNALWRALYHLELPRIVRYEQRVADQSDEIWFVSDRDRRSFAARAKPGRVHVVPNTVDKRLFDVEAQNEVKPVLLFVGNLEVQHNIDAINYLIQDIMPLVRREHAECRVRIVGAGDPQAVISVTQQPGVEIAGYVRNLGNEFAASTLVAAPLRFSAGVQNKVVEAMAAGVPVVTSSAVCDGLGAVPERDLLVGDDPATFAAHVGRLLQDEHYRRQLGKTGRAFVDAHFKAQFAAERLRAIAEQMQGNSG